MKIGIDLGGSHIAIGVINHAGRIVEKIEKRITSKEKKDIQNSIETYIIEHVHQMQEKYKISTMGIAIPGTVSKEMVIKSVNLGLKEYPIIENLRKQINLPITIRNDAKCAAIAESQYGVLQSYTRSLFLTLGTGIGGAVIINHELLDTGDLSGCEFGHIVIQKDGVLCRCGKKGCFEKYASMKSFKDNLRTALGLDEKTRGEELLDKIRKNTENNEDYDIITQVVNEYIENLAIGISNLINIFEPEAVGIGGSFVFFEDVFLPKVKEYIQKHKLLFNPRKELIIETGILNNDAGMVGSIL